jgi:hypothetical protein
MVAVVWKVGHHNRSKGTIVLGRVGTGEEIAADKMEGVSRTE